MESSAPLTSAAAHVMPKGRREHQRSRELGISEAVSKSKAANRSESTADSRRGPQADCRADQSRPEALGGKNAARLERRWKMSKKKTTRRRNVAKWSGGKPILEISDVDLGRRLFRLVTGEHAGDPNLLNVECASCGCQFLEFGQPPALEALGELLKRGPRGKRAVFRADKARRRQTSTIDKRPTETRISGL